MSSLVKLNITYTLITNELLDCKQVYRAVAVQQTMNNKRLLFIFLCVNAISTGFKEYSDYSKA